MLPRRILQEWALNNYRAYVATFHSASSDRAEVLLRNFQQAVEDLLTHWELRRAPTAVERAARELEFIARVEAEFADQPLPPRPHPHGL